MYISKIAAQEIVEEIGKEIREHVNLMDEEGCIIASTDASRIGSIHDGARRIITEGLPELYISAEMETRTTRRGINLPLIAQGEIVGVVGITGDKERVTGYGNIVRRMTEIMMEESMLKDDKRFDRRVRYRFMEEWIAHSNTTYSRNFIERGQKLGIDILRPYRAMVILFVDYHQLYATLEGQKILEDMETSVRHEMERNGMPYLRETPMQICMYPSCSNEEMRRNAEKLRKMIYEKYKRKIAVGIDGSTGNKQDIRKNCSEAEKAANHAFDRREDISFYDDLHIELVLNEISESVMIEYEEKLFAKIPKEKRGDYLQLITCYFSCDGSIEKMSKELYMHKNTVQYKLKKLAEYTGKDIRVISNAPIYYMAMMFGKNL